MKYTWSVGLAVVVSLRLRAGALARASVVTFSTDQTGANTQIDIDPTTIYDIYVLPGQSVTGILGDFTIKRRSKTTEPITFSLWSGVDGLGTRPASSSPAASSVSQSYESRIFDLDPLDAPLGPGSYSVQLSCMTGDQGSRQYVFKGGKNQWRNLATVSTVPPPSGGGTPPAVPEPSTSSRRHSVRSRRRLALAAESALESAFAPDGLMWRGAVCSGFERTRLAEAVVVREPIERRVGGSTGSSGSSAAVFRSSDPYASSENTCLLLVSRRTQRLRAAARAFETGRGGGPGSPARAAAPRASVVLRHRFLVLE